MVVVCEAAFNIVCVNPNKRTFATQTTTTVQYMGGSDGC